MRRDINVATGTDRSATGFWFIAIAAAVAKSVMAGFRALVFMTAIVAGFNGASGRAQNKPFSDRTRLPPEAFRHSPLSAVAGLNAIGWPTTYADFAVNQTNLWSSGVRTYGNSAFAISTQPNGSGVNGPATADVGLTISAVKNNWKTSSTLGEMDGLYVIARQGQDDNAGVLVDTGTVAGFTAVLEGQAKQFAPTTGVTVGEIDAQIAEIETGLTGGAGSAGFVATATQGAQGTGLLVQSASGASWATAIQVSANGAGGATFAVTPAGAVKSTTEIFPGTGGAMQTGGGLLAGAGNPSVGAGSNGDFYFRTDCTHGSSNCLWHKERGAWQDLN